MWLWYYIYRQKDKPRTKKNKKNTKEQKGERKMLVEKMNNYNVRLTRKEDVESLIWKIENLRDDAMENGDYDEMEKYDNKATRLREALDDNNYSVIYTASEERRFLRNECK